MQVKNAIALVLVILAFCGGASAQTRSWSGGVAVLGDSYSDEYQFYPVDRAAARNWVEMLATTRGVDFGPFSTTSRGEPRNQGYAYNWARSAATTDSMLEQGQHTGAAEQVARGEVGLVWIFIGGNDFIAALHSDDPLAELPKTTARAAANVAVAVNTILDAHPDVQVVLTTVPNVADLPEFVEPIRSGRMPSAFAVAADQEVRNFNAELLSWKARDPRVHIADLYWPTRIAARLSPHWSIIAGLRLDRREFGNDARHVFLQDGRHVGTISQSLMAQLFLNTVGRELGADVSPLSNNEIIEFAASVPAPPSLGEVLVQGH